MHSPWGLLYQIVKETGYTWHYILWKVNRTNLMLMMADRANIKYGKKDEEGAKTDTGRNLARRFNKNKKG